MKTTNEHEHENKKCNVTCLVYIRYYPGIIPSFKSTGRVDVVAGAAAVAAAAASVVVIIAILIINVFLKQIKVPFNCTIKNV